MSSMPVAMILAAGRGKRLQPLTDTCPKPLLPLNGKPLIEYHLEALASAGIQKVVINCAWLPEQFPEKLGDGSRWGMQIHYSFEPEGGLETAGGIICALSELGEQPFILINGDVFTNYPIQKLVESAQRLAKQSEVLGHAVLVPNPAFKETGDFGLVNQKVQPQGDWTFSGMSVLSPKLFANMQQGFLPLAPILRDAMSKQLITGEVFEGYWSDVGTIERLTESEQWLQSQ